MYCNHCGKKLSADDHFCSQCGKRVERPVPWTNTASDTFDETMLYRPDETLDALHQDRELAEERHYEREQSARAAKRLREKRLQQQVPEEGLVEEEVSEQVEKKKLFSFKNPFTKKQENLTDNDSALDEYVIEEDVLEDPQEDTVVEKGYRHLYMGIIIIGMVIGVILGLFIMKPWDKPEESGPAPIAVVTPAELPIHL